MTTYTEMAEQFLASHAQVNQKLGEQYVETALGHYAKEAIAAGQPLSREGARQWLVDKLAQALADPKRGAPEQDQWVQILAGAVRFLDASPLKA